MTKQVSMIAATASQVATAYAAHIAAGETLSVAKFDAVVNFAASVATRLRVEHINKGSNLETNGKGELVALLDLSKQQREAFVTAFVAAGIGEKDAANIASMGRTVSRVFVRRMVDTTAITAAVSGNDMAAFIRQSLLDVTGDKASYNELEKARTRGWEAPSEEVEASAPEADEGDKADAADVDLDATLDSPPAPAPEAEASEADTPQSDLSGAIATLRQAMQGEAWDALNEAGFGAFLADARKAWAEAAKAEAEAAKAIASA